MESTFKLARTASKWKRKKKRDVFITDEDHSFHENVRLMKRNLKEFNETKMKRLKELDLFVLDNSIRETTVGQLKGHTLDDKVQIYNEVSVGNSIEG